MKLSFFKLDLNKLRSMAVIEIAIIAFLSLSNLFLVTSVINKEEIIIQSPPSFCEGVTLTAYSMDEDSQKHLGYILAKTIGDVNPSNVDYVRKAVLAYSHSSIYKQVNDVISDQLDKIKLDEITMSFEPDRMIFEDGKVFISGLQVIEGLTGKKDRIMRTYEFVFDVKGYNPSFIYMNTYEGQPHTLKWKAQNEKKPS